MTTLYTQPYDITAIGFFFETTKKYQQKVSKLKNSAGWPVEAFELQFIDGEGIDAKLFEVLGVNRGGPVLLDSFAAKLSYNRLVDIMLLPSIYEWHAPHKFEPYYKPHHVFVHDTLNRGASGCNG